MKFLFFTAFLSTVSTLCADVATPQQQQQQNTQQQRMQQQMPQNQGTQPQQMMPQNQAQDPMQMQPMPQDMQMATDVVWVTDFDAAQKMAKEQNKPIFLYFTGSDWCPWCMKMDREILSTKGFKDVAGSSFIFVKIDSPRYLKLDPKLVDQNKRLKEQYKIIGFPTILILDPDMNQVGMFYYKEESGDSYAKKLVDAWKEYQAKKSSVAPQK